MGFARQSLRLAILAIITISLGGCGFGANDIQFEGKVFDMIGMDKLTKAPAEPKLTERAPIVLPPETKLPEPDRKKHLFIDDEMLTAFFERLEKETEQEKVNFRFVLTLVLMRKRRLKYDSSKVDSDKEIWRLRVVGENQFVEVINPHLDEEQIGQLSSQIGQILQVDL